MQHIRPVIYHCIIILIVCVMSVVTFMAMSDSDSLFINLMVNI